MCSELLRLDERAASQRVTRNACGKAQIVLDACTRTRLATGCTIVEHRDRQPFGCRVDGRR